MTDPQVVTFFDSGMMAEVILLSHGVMALDVLKPKGKWKPVLSMTADEARKLAVALNTAADETDRRRTQKEF